MRSDDKNKKQNDNDNRNADNKMDDSHFQFLQLVIEPTRMR